jgi:hypothetical protein
MCDCVRKYFSTNRGWKVGCIVIALTMAWLGIHTLVIFVQGNRNPSLPMTTPCPALNASMMPMQYQLEGIDGWNFKTIVKPAVGSDGRTLPLPSGLEIVVENHCFNIRSETPSVFLWVNNQLAAFSNIDRDIYDCHGDRIFDTAYDTSSSPSSLKVKSSSGNLIWTSTIPVNGKELIINGQPDNARAASISSDGKVTIVNALSAAADPRLIVMM